MSDDKKKEAPITIPQTVEEKSLEEQHKELVENFPLVVTSMYGSSTPYVRVFFRFTAKTVQVVIPKTNLFKKAMATDIAQVALLENVEETEKDLIFTYDIQTLQPVPEYPSLFVMVIEAIKQLAGDAFEGVDLTAAQVCPRGPNIAHFQIPRDSAVLGIMWQLIAQKAQQFGYDPSQFVYLPLDILDQTLNQFITKIIGNVGSVNPNGMAASPSVYTKVFKGVSEETVSKITATVMNAPDSAWKDNLVKMLGATGLLQAKDGKLSIPGSEDLPEGKFVISGEEDKSDDDDNNS